MTDGNNTVDPGRDDELEEIRRQVEARKEEEAALLSGDSGDSGNGDRPVTSRFIQDCLYANELGDGMLYAEIHGGRFLFNKSASEWLEWKGHHWGLDIMDNHLSAVETVAQRYLQEAYDIVALIDKASRDKEKDRVSELQKKQQNIYKRVQRLRKESGRVSCIKFAHTNIDNPLAVPGDKLDKNPWLFACKNGVVDLRTGKLRPGKPDDFLFRSSPIEWTGIDTPAPIWENFLMEVFEKKEDIINFVLRLLGYGLAGLTNERILPVFCGAGWNGKGTIVEIVMHIVGDYASPIQSEMLLDQGKISKSASGVSPDIMALRGLRIAFASETDEGRKFSTSRVKWLTGGDTLTGRNPYDKRPTSFLPTHTLFLMTNHEPKAPPRDFAFWNRVFLIPFNLSFVDNPIKENHRQRDKELLNKLMRESSGILASLVRGGLEWQRIGLDPPSEIIKATAKYRQTQDNLSDFIDECCYINKDATVTASGLYDKFEEWWTKNVSKNAPKQKTFGKWMTQAEFKKEKSGTYKYFGIGLLDEAFGR